MQLINRAKTVLQIIKEAAPTDSESTASAVNKRESILAPLTEENLALKDMLNEK